MITARSNLLNGYSVHITSISISVLIISSSKISLATGRSLLNHWLDGITILNFLLWGLKLLRASYEALNSWRIFCLGTQISPKQMLEDSQCIACIQCVHFWKFSSQLETSSSTNADSPKLCGISIPELSSTRVHRLSNLTEYINQRVLTGIPILGGA